MQLFRRLFKYLFLTGVSVYLIFWLLSIPVHKQVLGVSFRPEYAMSLGLDWKKTYSAIITDLKPHSIRIAAEWANIEPVKGKYEFSDLDWMVKQAEEQNVKIVLALGQKTPRWPECHNPEWVRPMSQSARKQFFNYVKAVVTRYRSSKAVEIWQVENEPFIEFHFGQCADLHPEWVEDEIAMVKSLDASRQIVVTDSGELGLWTEASETGDILGTTLYRRVAIPSGKLLHYVWLPPGAYTAHAWLVGKTAEHFFVSELQAEPWYTNSNALTMPVNEQIKQFSPDDLAGNIRYASHVGASRVYLWGAEWWYFMKEKNTDSRYWKMGKSIF
jgi:hypothetical protein